MALTELVLGATRAVQLLLSIITLGLASGTVHTLTRANIGALAPNRYSLFAALFGLLSVLFLVTSQFLFVHQYNGYNVYITTGVILEVLNWIFIFAAWVSIAQFGTSSNCHPSHLSHALFAKTCGLDRALVAFMILLWVAWTISLVIMIRLKLNEAQDQKSTKEIEMRIKSAVEHQSGREDVVHHHDHHTRSGDLADDSAGAGVDSRSEKQ